MKRKCEGCGKPLTVPDGMGAVVCRNCLDALELDIALELAKGFVEYRCEACKRRRRNWVEGSRCECGSRTVVLTVVEPRAN